MSDLARCREVLSTLLVLGATSFLISRNVSPVSRKEKKQRKIISWTSWTSWIMNAPEY